MNNLRLLTAPKPVVPVLGGKSASEIRRENVILIVYFTFLFLLFGLVIWASWHR